MLIRTDPRTLAQARHLDALSSEMRRPDALERQSGQAPYAGRDPRNLGRRSGSARGGGRRKSDPVPLTISGLFSGWAVYRDNTTDGSSNISQLADQTSGGRHAKQATSGDRPALLASDSALGNNPSASFDASNTEHLTVDATATDYDFLHATEFTALVIFSATGVGTDSTVYSFLGNTHTNPGVAIQAVPGNNVVRLIHRRDTDNTTLSDTGNIANGGNYAVVSYKNGRSPEIEVRVNGNTASTGAGATGAAGSTTRQLDLGRRSSTTGSYYNDTISEWWIYNTAYDAGSDEVASLESYAAGRI